MKYKIIAILVLMIGSHADCLGGRDLANDDNAGRKMFWIERILRLEDDQIDVANAVLVLSREWGSARRTRNYYLNSVDRMAEEILARMDKQKVRPGPAAIPIINKYLFEEIGFEALDTADDPEDLFLHSVLDKKQGYCLSLSVLYLGIGERIGLKLHGVVVPGHFFIRYDDGRFRFNIETTSKGNSASDEHYINKFKPPAGKKTVYMKNLTKKQTLGCYFNNLGNCYSIVGETDNAYHELVRAVTINPSLTEAHTNLGNVYLKMGMPEDAIEEYKTSLGILPEDPKTRNNIANAYSQIGKHDLAIREYRTAIRLKPDFADAYRNLANVLRMIGKPASAIPLLKKAALLKPDDALTYVYLGDTSREIKEYANAVVFYRKAANMIPDSVPVRVNLAYSLLDIGYVKPAIEEFNNALNIDPQTTNAWFGLAIAYNKLKQTDDEIFAYEQLLIIKPDSPDARLNLGNAFIESKMYDHAIEQYLAGAELSPKNPSFYFNLGVSYSNRDDHVSAAAQFDYTIQLDANNAAAHNGLAIASYMLGEFEKAKKHALIAKELGFEVQEQLIDTPTKK